MPTTTDIIRPPEIEEPVCEPPSNSAQPVPSKVVFYQGRPVPATEAPGPEATFTGEEVVKQIYAEGPPICLNPADQGHRLPEHMGRMHSLWGMAAGVKAGRPKVARPTNHLSVPTAGRAVLDAHRNAPKGNVMDLDAAKLEGDLKRHDYLSRCRRAAGTLVEQLDNNIAYVEVDINDAVRDAIKDVAGLLDHPMLAETLAPALEHIRGPAEQAQITRGLVSKAFQSGKAAGHAEAKASATPPAPPAPPAPPKPER